MISYVWAERQARDGAQTPALPAVPLTHLHHQDAKQLPCSQHGKKPRVKDKIKGRCLTPGEADKGGTLRNHSDGLTQTTKWARRGRCGALRVVGKLSPKLLESNPNKVLLPVPVPIKKTSVREKQRKKFFSVWPRWDKWVKVSAIELDNLGWIPRTQW